MLSAGSGPKMFGALKVTILCQIFELSVHKMSNFLSISACKLTMPSGLFAQIISKKISVVVSSC